MTNPMLAELDEVVRLMEAATPGPWESASRGRYYVGQQEDEASVHGADDADIDEVSNVSPLHLADTIRGDCYKPDADLIAAAVNFLRTHHATLADMAKRMEAAERDARRWRFVRAKIALGDASVFAAMNDAIPDNAPDEGPVIEGMLDDGVDAAIDATQEGEAG